MCVIKKENADSKLDELSFKNPVKVIKGKNIKTGYKANLWAWIILCMLALIFISGLATAKIKKLKRRIAK